MRWLAVAVFAAIAFAYVHPLRAYWEARSERATRIGETQALERERRELAARLAVARTDAFVEREARKLGLVRPGERLFILTGAGE